jgi:NADH-quinone oxidoreductase subunit L
MLLPLVVLGLLSFIGGWVGVPEALGGHNEIQHFLDPVFAATTSPEGAVNADQVSHGLEIGLAVVSVLTAAVGFFFAWLFYYKKPGSAAELATKFAPVYSLVEHKFYVDEVYSAVFVTGLLGFTRLVLYTLGDRLIVDGFGRFSSWVAMDFAEAARRIQSGNIRSYAGWLAFGAALVMAVMIFGFGHLGFAR